MSDPHPIPSEDLFDTIVIGAGQAGPGLASTLAGRGERVALIQDGPFGGTCLNDGCRPTKALRASARAAHSARTAARLGVRVGEVTVDLAAVVARKDQLVHNWRDRFGAHYRDHPSISYLDGRGRLTGTSDTVHHVDVDGRELRARRVVLNTGARSVPPPVPGLDTINWLDHHSILDLTTLPERLVVIGGSYIGLELGQIFRRFGSHVTIVERADRIIPREDPEISDQIAEFLRAEDIDIRTATGIDRIEPDGDGARLTLDTGDALSATRVLVAAGRRPNSDDLGLDTVGVNVDERGFVVTDEHFATNVEGIYAVGDVNGRGAFTHTSYQDHEILADHLAGGERSVAGRIPTYALFTDPPLGRVGLTEMEVRQRGEPYLAASYPMSDLTRAVLDRETAGSIKLIVDQASGRFLGAAALGLGGDEIIQTVSVLMHVDAPADSLASWLPIHPTVAEFLPTIWAQLSPPAS